MPTGARSDLDRLREKLCRELAQSELDASLHCRREAGRLGDVPPARAFLDIAAHAEALRPRLEAVIGTAQPLGLALGHTVGRVFSAVRHVLLDRLIDAERSYRGTLLGLRHGVDAARLLREVAARQGHAPLVTLCEELVPGRLALLEGATLALAYFADAPGLALTSGARLALPPTSSAPGAPHRPRHVGG